MSKSGGKGALFSVSLDHDSSLPLYRQILRGLKTAIISGRLEGHARLPATRTLASELGVSRNTIISVYNELAAEGYVFSKVGNGTYVSDRLPEEHQLPSGKHEKNWQGASTGENVLSLRGQQMAELSEQPLANDIVLARPFCADLPAVDAFPIETWGRLMRKNWQRITPAALAHPQPAGYEPLQQAIARYLSGARFIRCDASQVIITSGSQQSLDLIARLLIDPGDPVWLEEPGYIGARRVLAAAGANLVPVPVDDEGMNVDYGNISHSHPRAIYISPSRQYPLGMTMSSARRAELIEYANKIGAWIIEDDYDSEYRYDGVPLPAMQSLQKADRLIYLGTFSKSLLPALKHGYIVVPKDLVSPFITGMSVITRPNSIIDQMTLNEFISTGQFAAHVRRMRRLYLERQAILLEHLEKHLGEFIEVKPTTTGTHLTAFFKVAVDDVAFCEVARKKGISLRPLSIYYMNEPKQAGLILGFAATAVPRIITGVDRLVAFTQEYLRSAL
jgi:GntR family transcriptional regulator / MocR family aminotransferase